MFELSLIPGALKRIGDIHYAVITSETLERRTMWCPPTEMLSRWKRSKLVLVSHWTRAWCTTQSFNNGWTSELSLICTRTLSIITEHKHKVSKAVSFRVQVETVIKTIID